MSLWTPLAEPRIAARWFSLPNFYFLWPVPVVTALTAYRCLALARDRAARCRRFWRRSRCSCSGYLGLVISNFPYLVPPSLTVWDTAAAPASQIFMLLGTLLLLPIDARLRRVHLLAVPRQGARRRELSLGYGLIKLFAPAVALRADIKATCRDNVRSGSFAPYRLTGTTISMSAMPR